MQNPELKLIGMYPVYEDKIYAILSAKDLSLVTHATDIAHIGANMLFAVLKNQAPLDRKVIIDGLIDKLLDVRNGGVTTKRKAGKAKSEPSAS